MGPLTIQAIILSSQVMWDGPQRRGQKLLDEDQADILEASTCLLAAAAAVKKAKTKAMKRRVKRERKKKCVG